MPTLDEELAEIAATPDIDSICKRKSARKGQYTRLNQLLHKLLALPPGRTPLRELERKVAEAKRSAALYHAMQDRHEELLASNPEAREVEERVGWDNRQEYDELVNLAELLVDRTNIHHKASVLQEELRSLIDVEHPHQEVYQQTFKTLQPQIANIKELASQYPDDEHVKEHVERLNLAVARFQKLTADAQRKSKSPTPAISTTTSHDVTEPTRTVVTHSRLKLDLPRFSGEPTDWMSFKTLFSAAMDREGSAISDHEKVTHLLSCLTTSAAKQTVKQHATAADGGYKEAVQALEDAYGGCWRIYPQHVRALLKNETYSYTPEGLRHMREVIDVNLKGLELCGGSTLQQFLGATIISRFDKTMAYEWSHHWEDLTTLPTVLEVRDFFRKRELCMVDQPSYAPKSINKHQHHNKYVNNNNRRRSPPLPPVQVVADERTCPACKKGFHSLSRCQTFLDMTLDQRQKTVREGRLCNNCFHPSHMVKDCSSAYTCRHCQGRHHTLLHRDGTKPKNKDDNTSTNTSDGGCMVTYGTPQEPAIISTAMFKAINGRTQQLGRALLDSGSVPSLVTEKMANALRLERTPCKRAFTCATGRLLESKSTVTINLASLDKARADESLPVTCHVVKHLPATVPPKDAMVVLKPQQQLGRTPAADPALGGEIDILLGVSDSSRCHRGSRQYTPDQAGYAVPTIFRWILGGKLPGAPTEQTVFCIQPTSEALDNQLQRLWDMDKVPEDRTPTEEEQQAVKHFKQTHQILPNGRFAVELPRKKDPPVLGHSRPTALKRFLRNEKNLVIKGHLQGYNEVLKEYFTLGHAQIIPPEEVNISPHQSYYFPIHGVRKESSTTTKYRAVFDASCKTSSGASLNDTLLPGPNLYPHLTTILIKFRQHQVAISADIGKMFREVLLQLSERDYHRFLFRDEEGIIKDCRMLRLTFGVTSSPFLATKVLHQLAEQVADEYPLAAKAITSAFYVDDCLTGGQTVEEASDIASQLIKALEGIGMQLRKFRSNSIQFLNNIPEQLKETSDLTITDNSSSAKTLGIHWHVKLDTFAISVPDDKPDTVTKRIVASTTAKVYDILGFFSPVTILAKNLLQELWRQGLGWDQEPNNDIKNRWIEWVNALHVIAEHPIPRCIYPANSTDNIQLHGFSDASTTGYGAVVYVRVTTNDNKIRIALVMSKARVAPVKTTSIPKMELSAAVLLARLVKVVAEDLCIPMAHVYCWTDSTVVLSWLGNSPTALQTYEANRVSTIQTIIGRGQWRHVKGKDNPADLPSRGVSAPNLVNNDLWWLGPSWLQLPPDKWYYKAVPIKTDGTGFKRQAIALATNVMEPWQLWTHHSNFHSLIKTVAWWRRFINNFYLKVKKQPTTNQSKHLEQDKLHAAKLCVLRWAQQQSLPEVVRWLKDRQLVPHSHWLGKYDLTLDAEGIVQLRGRVRQTQGREPRRLLPLSLKSPIARLIVDTAHRDYHHPGASTLICLLGETYYLPGIRNYVKGLTRKCVKCQKALAHPTNQRMGLLPSVRTTPAPPFYHTGVDFAGPFLITRGNPRKPTRVKVYAAIFICMITRAVHWELCSGLATADFIATLQWFCARRGTPARIYSDNGTNFIGTKREQEEVQQLLTQEAKDSHQDIKWHLSPPRAPHFGGLWEAGVRSMKQLLRKNLSTTPLSYEELSTILVEMEAVLNSRPLEQVSSTDPDKLDIITPGHFLIGRPLLAPPPTNVDMMSKITVLRRWNFVQRTIRDLWTKWRASYLQALGARNKWHQTRRNFQPGDVVLLKDDALGTRNWPLALITEANPGTDGLVRVVKLRCQGQDYTRATNRLVLLVAANDLSCPRRMSEPNSEVEKARLDGRTTPSNQEPVLMDGQAKTAQELPWPCQHLGTFSHLTSHDSADTEL